MEGRLNDFWLRCIKQPHRLHTGERQNQYGDPAFPDVSAQGFPLSRVTVHNNVNHDEGYLGVLPMCWAQPQWFTLIVSVILTAVLILSTTSSSMIAQLSLQFAETDKRTAWDTQVAQGPGISKTQDGVWN